MLDLSAQASRKIGPGVSRVVSLDAVEAMARSCIGKVPVTRISDLSPLDPLCLPVFCAVTPLARDLTTHLGKGTTRQAARVSAMMEAIERVSAECAYSAALVASFDELRLSGKDVIDPSAFNLPPDSAYSTGAEFRWMAGVDLISRRETFILEDLVISPPHAGVLRHPDTNGLASGANHLEAIVHALAEVVERDAISQRLFAELYLEPGDAPPPLRRIDPQCADQATQDWLTRITDSGMHTLVEDCTTDIAIPVFRAVIVDHDFPSPRGPTTRRFVGYGCDLSPQTAIRRAVTEAVQSRLAVIQGARDSFNTTPLPVTAAGHRMMRLDFQPGLMANPNFLPEIESDDLSVDLDRMLTALEQAGLTRVIAVDLTRPDFGVPVVRVRVPGLSRFLVDRSRPGWRCMRYLL